MATGFGNTEKAMVSPPGALPQWDLSDLYPGRDSAELERCDLEASHVVARQFRARYEGGKLAELLRGETHSARRSPPSSN